jgi:7-cyano-7-deazaguanine synthase
LARSAIVLVSGGLDSATVLAMARADGWRCHALSVDYGQRHRAELDAAARVARALGAVEHRVVQVNLGAFGGSALTDPSIAVPSAPAPGIPVTYVPARNTVFLSLALAHAEVTASDAIFTERMPSIIRAIPTAVPSSSPPSRSSPTSRRSAPSKARRSASSRRSSA